MMKKPTFKDLMKLLRIDDAFLKRYMEAKNDPEEADRMLIEFGHNYQGTIEDVNKVAEYSRFAVNKYDIPTQYPKYAALFSLACGAFCDLCYRNKEKDND